MKNWKKGGIALLLMIALNGCKAWNCGCPMSKVTPVDGCSLAASPSTINHQRTTIN